jgi:hypothetical protein
MLLFRKKVQVSCFCLKVVVKAWVTRVYDITSEARRASSRARLVDIGPSWCITVNKHFLKLVRIDPKIGLIHNL